MSRFISCQEKLFTLQSTTETILSFRVPVEMIPHIHILSPKPQRVVELPDNAKFLKVEVHGYDNSVCVRATEFDAHIHIFGCNNTVTIEEDCVSYGRSQIWIGDKNTPCFGCKIHIGRGGIYTALDLRLFDRKGEIYIGENCLMSWDVMIWGSDTHALFDAENQLRRGRRVEIGNHVWVGHGCHIGKNTHIADGCVVGWGSVVAGRFEEPNCVIAGNPARVVRRGVRWSRQRPDDFIPEREADLQQYADWAEERPQPRHSRGSIFKMLLKVLLLWGLVRTPGVNRERMTERYRRAKGALAGALARG